jgi:hypothetical protein
LNMHSRVCTHGLFPPLLVQPSDCPSAKLQDLPTFLHLGVWVMARSHGTGLGLVFTLQSGE